MQFPDIITYCGKENLRPDISLATGQKTAKVIIFLHNAKCALELDRTVHAKLYACFTCNTIQGFRPLFDESHGYRHFPVTFRFGASGFVWTSLTAFTLVVCDLTDKSGLAFSSADVFRLQLHAVLASIFIPFSIIVHILAQGHVALEFLGFRTLIICRFDVAPNLLLFQITGVFFTLIAHIRCDILVLRPKLFFHLLQ